MGDQVFGQIADGDDLHRAVHAAAFDVVDALVDVDAGTIELGAVYVNDEGNPLDAGDGHSSGEGHPVMGVNDVDRFLPGDLARQCGVSLNFRKEIARVRGGPAPMRRHR